MPTLREPARETPVAHECDLCIVGGSCTGVFAAVRAAQLGAEVCVVESNGFFGGVATAGLVNIWHSLLDTQNERQIIGGLTWDVIQRLKQRNAVLERVPNESSHFVLNTAELTIELDQLVVEHGIRPFLHARFVQPVMEDGRVTAAIIEDRTGRRAIRARMFIDATGDGDLIARAGFPFRKLDDLQPPTMCFHLHGLAELAKQNDGFSLGEVVHDTQYPEALEQGFLWSAGVPGVPDLTMVAGTRAHNADCSDADELTQASLDTRQQVRRICDLLRNHLPGGESVALAATAPHIGIRETRHAECLHTLTEEEVRHGVRFDDAIANGTYHVDAHHSNKAGLTFRYLDGREDYVAPGEPHQSTRWRPEQDEDPTFYQIPYRTLVPKGRHQRPRRRPPHRRRPRRLRRHPRDGQLQPDGGSGGGGRVAGDARRLWCQRSGRRRTAQNAFRPRRDRRLASRALALPPLLVPRTTRRRVPQLGAESPHTVESCKRGRRARCVPPTSEQWELDAPSQCRGEKCALGRSDAPDGRPPSTTG